MALVTSWSDSAGVWPDFRKTAEALVVLSPLSMALHIAAASVSACMGVFGGCPCAVWTWLSKSTYADTWTGCPGWWLLLPGGAVGVVVPTGASGVAVCGLRSPAHCCSPRPETPAQHRARSFYGHAWRFISSRSSRTLNLTVYSAGWDGADDLTKTGQFPGASRMACTVDTGPWASTTKRAHRLSMAVGPAPSQ